MFEFYRAYEKEWVSQSNVGRHGTNALSFKIKMGDIIKPKIQKCTLKSGLKVNQGKWQITPENHGSNILEIPTEKTLRN